MGDPVYLRVGTAFQDSFFYLSQNALRTPVTGKVQANFTIRLSKDGVGNQATTGITLTEVDSVNNPGEYGLAVALSAFPAAAGHYVLRVIDTTNTQYSWSWSIFVTSDGTASAPIGPALFTPTASNGRVTDGTSALLGATIIIRTATGALYYSALTDSSGLWTAVNFPATNATYTVYAIRSGYLQASGTITVAAGVATGPGTDLAMAAATTSAGFDAASLWAYARRSGRNALGTTGDTEVKQAVTEALERVATCHRWPWYRSYAELTLRGAYTTGTVTVTLDSPIVTLAAGTWPTWAEGAKFRISGQYIKVLTRDSNTQVTLEADWAEATASGQSYVLYQDEYELPDDLYRFGQILPGQRWGWGPSPIGAEQLDALQNAMTFGQKFADFFAIQKQSVFLSSWPTMDTNVRYSYYRRPATLVSSIDIADWDPAHIRLLRRAIDCEIALRFGGYVGGTIEQALRAFKDALDNAIPNDRSEVSEAGVLGSAFSRGGGVEMWKRRG